MPELTPTLLGIPFDANSSYMRGAAAAPPKIREALRCDSSNMWTELGVDLGVAGAFADAGDLQFDLQFGDRQFGDRQFGDRQSKDLQFKDPQPQNGDAFAAIERAVDALLQEKAKPLSLGGDHSITYPIMKAFARHHPPLTIVHFDAHPDLYDEFEGNRHSHACPFARIMEQQLAQRLVQVGIRTMSGLQRAQAERFSVEVVEMRALPAYHQLQANGPVYISFDMDVLDPAFAPGVSHREPGGMSVREAIAHLHAIKGHVVGADLVEYNPAQDVSGLTATAAGRILKEILGKMIAG
jgi:arginase